MSKDINYLVLSYPNFVLGTVINPDEANQNNADITNKINEFIDDVEEAWNNADSAVDTVNAVQADYTAFKSILETAKSNADTATANANTAATNANIAATNANNSASTIDSKIASKANATQVAWTNITLLNSWTNIGTPYKNAGYFKDSIGIVHLCGVITGGTATLGTQVFVLPAGYRPASTLILGAQNNGVYRRFDLENFGAFKFGEAGTNGYISLDGITFRAEQ